MDLIRLTAYHWKPYVSEFVTSEKNDFTKLFAEKTRDVRSLNIALLILQEILHSHTSQMQGCLSYEVKRIKSIFADKRNNGTRFRAPFLYRKYSSHSFNETDFEQ